MLLVSKPNERCVILDQDSIDDLTIEKVEHALGTSFLEMELVGFERRTITYQDRNRVTTSMADLLAPDRMEALEYQAYHYVDTLKDQISGTDRDNVVLTFYHEFAHFFFAALRAREVVVGASNRVVLVDKAIENAFRDCRHHWKLLNISDLDARDPSRAHVLAYFFRTVARRSLILVQPSRWGVVAHYYAYRFTARFPVVDRAFERFEIAGVFLERAQNKVQAFIKPFRLSRLGFDLATSLYFIFGSVAVLFQYAIGSLLVVLWLCCWCVASVLNAKSKIMSLVASMRISLKNRLALRSVEQVIAGDRTETSSLVVISVQDSGTRVNLDPALSIANELRSRGVATLVFTESAFVADEFGKANLPALDFGGARRWHPLKRVQVDIPALPVGNFGADEDARHLMNGVVRMHWKRLWDRLGAFDDLMQMVASLFHVDAVLSINETLPICVAAGLWVHRQRRPWIGHFPILLGRRPDCYFFPADEHLAYGEQLRDHMIATGVPRQSIEVVGSFTYDKHHGRDRAADRRIVDLKFPRAVNNKLITVATEAFPDCETELIPVLLAATSLRDTHVILKLHPEDSIDYFEALAGRIGVRREIDIVKSYPLSELLNASTLLICVMSNIAVEAAVLGTPTLMCDFSGKTKVMDFAAEGLCFGCRDRADLQPMLEKILFDEKFAAEMRAMMAEGIKRFNGPNDGRSTERIADFVLSRTAVLRGRSDGTSMLSAVARPLALDR